MSPTETGSTDITKLLQEAMELHRSGKWRQAAAKYRAALEIDADRHDIWGAMAQVFAQINDTQNATAAARRAVDLSPQTPAYHGLLAHILFQDRQAHDALVSAKRAIELDPKEHRAHTVAANCLERLNRLTEAMEHVDAAAKHVPNDPGVSLLRARLLRRSGRATYARPMLETLAAQCPAGALRARVLHELASVCDALGDYGSAWSNLQHGKEQLLDLPQTKAIDGEAYLQLIEDSREHLDAEVLRRSSKMTLQPQRPDPVFLIGFPRSGTTMTEQVLDAHPDVVTSDEQPFIAQLRHVIETAHQMSPHEPARLARLTEEQINGLRRQYWEVADAELERRGESVDGRVYIDKLPLNITAVGVINVLFPEAKLIVALRDPRDVVLSCHMQFFGLNPAMIQFQQLDRASSFYARVMSFWNEMKDRVSLPSIQVRYEDTVGNLEHESRRLLEFLGLDWQEDVLSFHERAHDRYISTPSAAAVSEPIHRRAVGRWENYRVQLESAMDTLQPFVEAFGYGANSRSH